MSDNSFNTDILRIILFVVNIITFLLCFINFIIVLSKMKKTRYDTFIILTRIFQILIFIYLALTSLGDNFINISGYDKFLVNQHISCVFYGLIIVFCFSSYAELSLSYTDAFNIIEYLLDKKVSVLVDFLFVLVILIPSTLLDILYSLDSTYESIKFIHIIDDMIPEGKQSLFFISYNPIIALLIFTILILSLLINSLLNNLSK